MVFERTPWRFKTRTMMGLIALIGFACGLFVWSSRIVWGPWPRWVRSIHSSGDYQSAADAAVAGVEGKVAGVHPESAIREVIGALDDPKSGTQLAALIAIGKAGPKAVASVPKLLILLRAPPPIRYYAAAALGQIVRPEDSNCDAVVSALMAVVEGSAAHTRANALVRVYAIQALLQLGALEGQRRTEMDRLLDGAIADDQTLVRAVAGLGLIRAGREEDACPVLAAIRKGQEGYETARLGLVLLGLTRASDEVWVLENVARNGTDPWLQWAAQGLLNQTMPKALGE
jgi:hypothetical protein